MSHFGTNSSLRIGDLCSDTESYFLIKEEGAHEAQVYENDVHSDNELGCLMASRRGKK